MAFMALPDRQYDVVAITYISGCSERFKDNYAIHWQSKKAFVVGDCDVSGIKGAEHWASAIGNVADSCVLVQLPYEIAPNKGKDLRDYIAAGHGYADLKQLAETNGVPASSIQSQSKPKRAHTEMDLAIAKETSSENPEDSVALYPEDDDPDKLADQFLAAIKYRKHAASQGKLIRYRDTFYEHRECVYRRVEDTDVQVKLASSIKASLDMAAKRKVLEKEEQEKNNPAKSDKPAKELKAVPIKGTRRIVSDTFQALMRKTYLPTETSTPCWLTDQGHATDAREILPLRNGWIHIPSLLAGKTTLEPLSNQLFSTFAVNAEFKADAQCPKWEETLESWWGDDPDSIKALQQYCGYLLWPESQLHKMLWIVGATRSGKGTFVKVLQSLLGDSVATASVDSILSQFGLDTYLDKRVIVVPELELSGRVDTPKLVERLKSISGGDSLYIDRKFKSPLPSAKIDAKIIITSNSLPKLPDESGALHGRLIMLNMPRSFS